MNPPHPSGLLPLSGLILLYPIPAKTARGAVIILTQIEQKLCFGQKKQRFSTPIWRIVNNCMAFGGIFRAWLSLPRHRAGVNATGFAPFITTRRLLPWFHLLHVSPPGAPPWRKKPPAGRWPGLGRSWFCRSCGRRPCRSCWPSRAVRGANYAARCKH